MIKPIAQGASLPLWLPDEEILAVNLNLRERKYGGFYTEDSFGMSTGIPTLNFGIPGELYGSGELYGFLSYSSVSGSGLISDSLSISDGSISTATVDATTYYNKPTLYGFAGYGVFSGNILNDNLTINDNTPVFSTGNPYTIYNNGDIYGFIGYGSVNHPISTLTITDSTVSLTSSNDTSTVYGSGEKYGFCSYDAIP